MRTSLRCWYISIQHNKNNKRTIYQVSSSHKDKITCMRTMRNRFKQVNDYICTRALIDAKNIRNKKQVYSRQRYRELGYHNYKATTCIRQSVA
jgi:hypothetical protein